MQTERQLALVEALAAKGIEARWGAPPGDPRELIAPETAGRLYLRTAARDERVFFVFDNPGECRGGQVRVQMVKGWQHSGWYEAARSLLVHQSQDAVDVVLAFGAGAEREHNVKAEAEVVERI